MNDIKIQTNIDKGLISMFLKLSIEERLAANDRAMCTTLELRNAFQQNKNRKRRAKLTPLKVIKSDRRQKTIDLNAGPQRTDTILPVSATC